jgi:HAD superfamily phosphoserine phosphatase-like hydrolase
MPKVTEEVLQETRKAFANIYIPKIEIGASYFKAKREGLLHHSDPGKSWTKKILPELTRAENHNVHFHDQSTKIIDAVVFPELSVPREYLKELADWSGRQNVIVIAGSHYELVGGSWCSACPVIINGVIYTTYKSIPSPFEDSGINDQGLQPGPEVIKFRNSRIGNFSVPICSDYLDDATRHLLIDDSLDLVIVIACQRGVEKHYSQAALDCQKSRRGLYVIYSNLLFGKYGEGKSAIFAQAHRDFEPEFKRFGYSDLLPREKLWCSSRQFPSVVVSLDLNERRPPVSKTTRTRTNVSIIQPFDYQAPGSGIVSGASDDRAFKMIAFDLDGTLIRGDLPYSWAAVWEKLADDTGGIRWRQLMGSYMRREISYSEWCATAAMEFRRKGITAIQIVGLAKTFKPVENCVATLEQLKKEGYRLILISGGIDVFLKASGIPVGIFDHVHINKLSFDSDGVILSVLETSYDFEHKSEGIQEICDQEGISMEDVVYVGDSINDKPLLKSAGFFIGFPSNDPEIALRANVSIPEPDLQKVYEVIRLGKPHKKNWS